MTANNPAPHAERIDRIERGLRPDMPLRAQPPEPAALADRMAYYETPGVSIAVIADGEIAWARGYGVREAGKPDPVTPDTLFQAASISKPVTAMAALRLVQEGRLDLDEDVNQYLRSWKVPPSDGWQPRITLRQLLSHTAGLTVHGFPGYLRSRPIPSPTQVLDGAPPANTPPVRVNAIPGTQFRYSGGGTTIVQVMLGDVLSQDFPALMRALVLDPLGMSQSTYEQPLRPERAAQAAAGHPSDGQPVPGGCHVYPEMAAAGLWTTPSDLARFAIAIQRALTGAPHPVLSTGMIQEMLTPQGEDHIGLGPFLEGSGDAARFGHSGGNEGFLCDLKASRSRGQGAVVMINSNRGGPIIGEIERAIAHEYGWPDFLPTMPAAAEVSAEMLAAYRGRYELRPGFGLTVAADEAGLTLQPTGQPPIPLFPESETKFFARAVNAEVTFEKDVAGQVSALRFQQNGREMTAPKTTGGDGAPAETGQSAA